jgi:hypothetical protein
MLNSALPLAEQPRQGGLAAKPLNNALCGIHR